MFVSKFILKELLDCPLIGERLVVNLAPRFVGKKVFDGSGKGEAFRCALIWRKRSVMPYYGPIVPSFLLSSSIMSL